MTINNDQSSLAEFITEAHNSLQNLKLFHEVQTELNDSIANGFNYIRDLFVKYAKDIESLDKRLKRIELLLAGHDGAGHA